MPPTSDLPLGAVADGVRIAVRLTPRARTDHVDGIVHLADGKPVLKVSVTAPPADGRANDALLRLLAAEWGVPRRDFAIVGGLKSRSKTLRIAGEPAALLQRLAGVLADLSRS